jgi:3D (Asp-Asp-Asp) domain-containing protein
MRTLLLALALACLSSGQARPARDRFVATAFSRGGTSAAGTRARAGTVAADTSVLPLGTRIRVSGAGPYSGTYRVNDKGANVRGRHIDIFMPNSGQARRFGKKVVQVKVLQWGDGRTDHGRNSISRGARPRSAHQFRYSRP